MRCAGRMICMTGGHGNRIGRVADGVDEVVKAVREQVHAGSDLVKIMATGGVMTAGVNPEDAHYSAEEMKAGITEAHRFHKCCASHAQGALGILNAVRGGIDSIEHGIFMDEECCREMKERGVWLVPTLAAVKNILKGYDDGDRSIPDYVIEKSRRVFDRHIAAIKMYYSAGGRIAMGTDAGTPHNRHGENARELEFMCDIGISSRDSLFFATASAADLMRLADHGRIKEGNVADLVVCDGDALADIKRAARKENHRMVVKRGIVARDNRAAFVQPGRPRRGGIGARRKAIPESFVEEIFFILVGIAWALGTPTDRHHGAGPHAGPARAERAARLRIWRRCAASWQTGRQPPRRLQAPCRGAALSLRRHVPKPPCRPRRAPPFVAGALPPPGARAAIVIGADLPVGPCRRV